VSYAEKYIYISDEDFVRELSFAAESGDEKAVTDLLAEGLVDDETTITAEYVLNLNYAIFFNLAVKVAEIW